MLAIVGASGSLGYATLNALLDDKLVPPQQIVCTTSSSAGAEKLENAKSRGVQVRRAAFDDANSFETALAGCNRLFLISSARTSKDYNDAPDGEGREVDHFTVLEAAKRAQVRHVYYTSLAFARPSKSRVMKAHERTEDWLAASEFSHVTIIREGLYSESWPLYLGHFDVKHDDRDEIVVAGDCRINWTSIGDLGLANAIILASPTEEWDRRTFYLSQEKSHSLSEVAAMVSRTRGKTSKLKIVSREDHETHYVRERDMDEPFIKWWSKTYDALNDNECEIDDSTLETFLARKGLKPTPMETTVAEMFNS